MLIFSSSLRLFRKILYCDEKKVPAVKNVMFINKTVDFCNRMERKVKRFFVLFIEMEFYFGIFSFRNPDIKMNKNKLLRDFLLLKIAFLGYRVICKLNALIKILEWKFSLQFYLHKFRGCQQDAHYHVVA